MKAMRSSTVSTGAMLLPTMVTVAAAVAFLVYGPIPQLADYHNFADQRMLLGVSHAFDVLSNAGFLLVGLAGVRRLWRSRERAVADGAWYGYMVFCMSLIATGVDVTDRKRAEDESLAADDRTRLALESIKD